MSALFTQYFSLVTLSLNAEAQAFVEALEITCPASSDWLAGRSRALMDALDHLLDGYSIADLLCVCPSNADFAEVLGHLDARGVVRRKVFGLACVRQCR
jgi:hypothetical protein